MIYIGVPFDVRTGPSIIFSISGQVRLPFTLYLVAVTGETLTQVISGIHYDDYDNII
jgi:hypothetical protein